MTARSPAKRPLKKKVVKQPAKRVRTKKVPARRRKGRDIMVTFSDKVLPKNRPIYTNGTCPRAPLFTVKQLTNMFFAREPHWIRWREDRGMLDTEDFEIYEDGVIGNRNASGAREYTLADVEKVVHALAQAEAIDGTQVRNALLLVRILGEIHGHFDP